jgi:cytochrome c peroxidase
MTIQTRQKDDPVFAETSPLLKPLKLDATQLTDLEAFLSSLDEPSTRILSPPLPPLSAQ